MKGQRTKKPVPFFSARVSLSNQMQASSEYFLLLYIFFYSTRDKCCEMKRAFHFVN